MRLSNQWANLGYAIGPAWRRRGYATEAARAVMDTAFRDLRLNRVEASMEVNHRASAAVA